LFADADGSTPITELEPLRAAIQRGADVAIGSRALQDEGRQVHYRIHRKVLGSLFNAVVRLLAVKGVKDTQCGFKLFSAEAAEEVFPLQTIDGFGFDVEILYVARRKGFRVAEVPVNWRDVTGSKVALLRDSLSMLRDVMAIRVRGARGRYGAVRHPRSDGKQGSRCSS
jgi:dolichyl-phosphate beta-glucosyltransferase